jgi:hypothetical protein
MKVFAGLDACGRIPLATIMATEPRQLTGKVVNGVIILDKGRELPEGTTVKVEPIRKSPGKRPSRLAEMLLEHAGVIDDAELPPDLADNLDHYLYSTPKRR